MTKHSELIGSFIRRGSFPLEADYIFNSEQELCEYYKIPENYAILHKGWLKIVSNDTEQSLYWCILDKETNKLTFKKLLSANTLEELTKKITNLSKDLAQEIKDRKSGDTALRGTEDYTDIPKDYNTILKLANAIQPIKEDLVNLTNEWSRAKEIFNKIAGTTDKTLQEIKEYIDTLDYKDLTVISEYLSQLNAFFNGVDLEHTTFLSNLEKLWERIQGTPLPSEPFRTFRGVEDALSKVNTKIDQLDDEITQIEIGVGLDSSGTYSPDKETKHLKNATSVMNALKILDGLIDEAVKNMNIEVKDTTSINLSVTKSNEANSISADVNISKESNNTITIKNDGLYSNVNIEYNKGNIEFYINGSLIKSIDLGLKSIFKKGFYSPDDESIHIIFKGPDDDHELIIPVSSLFTELQVDNSIPSNVVVLTKTRSEGQGADKLSGDVRIHENDYNILTRKENALYVDGRSSNLFHNGKKLDLVLDDIDSDNKSNLDKIEELKTQQAINTSDIADIKSDIAENKDDIKSLRDKQVEINNELTTTKSDLDNTKQLQNAKNLEQDRELSDIKDKIATNSSDISNIKTSDANQDSVIENINKTIQTLQDKLIDVEANNAQLLKDVEKYKENLADNMLKYVEITEEEYSKLTPDSKTIYFITDKKYIIFNSIVYTYMSSLLDLGDYTPKSVPNADASNN